MIKIDPHTHSSGISMCSHAVIEKIVDNKIAQGYDGAVLTNHCQAWYYQPSEHTAFMQRFVEEFYHGKKYATEWGFRLLLGIEVSISDPFYSDWLLYGVTEEFLLRSPCLYQLNQKQLFALCQDNGVTLIQAHPFRAPMRPAEPKYMHGVEINCSTGDLIFKDAVLRFASEENLLVVCGTDYHGKNPFVGGTYAPDGVQSGKDFGNYLATAKETRIFFGEEEFTVQTPLGRSEKSLEIKD